MRRILSIFFVLTLFTLSVSCFAQELPLKPKNEFSIEINYDFKTKPASDKAVVYESQVRTVSSTPLPYLTLDVKVLELNQGEVKVKINNNKSSSSSTKKVSAGANIPVILGFTDDVKDNVTANEYILTFLDNEKKPVNKIVIFVDEEGFFFVNGEKSGKF